MFSVALVCLYFFLSVCLSVCLLATLLKMLSTDCYEILWRGLGWWKEQEKILVAIQVTMLTAQYEIHYSLLITHYEQILMEFSIQLCNDIRNNWLKNWSELDHYGNSSNHKSGQYGDNELPWQNLHSLSAPVSLCVCLHTHMLPFCKNNCNNWKLLFLLLS